MERGVGWMNESAVRLEEQIISLFYLLFLPDGILPDSTGLEEVLQFGVENGITQILADIPGREELPEQYKRAGFSKAYLYRCYQKEEKSFKKQEDLRNGFTE